MLSAANYLLFIVFSIIVAAAGVTLLLAYVKHRRRLAAVRQQQQRYVTKLIRQHVVYRSNDVIETPRRHLPATAAAAVCDVIHCCSCCW